MLDKPMCERCERETLETYDIWLQRQNYFQVEDGGYDNKSSEVLGSRDYIMLCPDCWTKIRETAWADLCKATTIDHDRISQFVGSQFVEDLALAITLLGQALQASPDEVLDALPYAVKKVEDNLRKEHPDYVGFKTTSS